MASRLPSRAFQTLFARSSSPRPAASSPARQWQQLSRAAYSSEPAPPPLLAKLKGEVKTAMRAKDSLRLSILRSILADVLNASKTDKPIRTDVQLVSLLRKMARASQDAVEEFRAAGRQDLVDKEETTSRILDEYAVMSGVEAVSVDQLRDIVAGVIAGLRNDGTGEKQLVGEAMKALNSPSGVLAGKDFDRSEVARLVKEAVAEPKQ